MDLVFGRSPLLLLVVIVAAAAFAWWSYGRMAPVPPPRRRLLLAGLRFAALAVVLLLLFEPVLSRVAAREEAPVFAVLLDRTQSLAPEDGAGTGARQTLDALAEFPDLPAEARFYTFAADLQPLSSPPDSLAFAGARTDLTQALEGVARQFEGRNLRGVLLISDGRYNTGRNPLHLAERFAVPIHTLTVGDTTRPRDVRLAGVLTNEVAYAGVELPVRVAVQQEGYAGERAVVTLSEGARVLAQEALTLPGDGLEATVELTVTPEGEGVRRYTASVTRFEGEATHRNNTASVAVQVLSTRRRVLLLAAAPGPDVAALRQELEADPNLEVVPRTQRAPGAYYEGAFPSTLGGFDLVVMAGFPGRASAPEHTRALATAAEGGLPLLFVLTQQTDLGALAGPLGEALPARPAAARPEFFEAQLRPTSAGALHPVLGVPGVPAGLLGRLPPVLRNESRWAVSPDARPLAAATVRGVALDDPLLLVRQRGESRSAALLAAGTWRWRTLPPDLAELSGFYAGLVQNLVRWLTVREDARPVRVRAAEPLFDASERVRLTGQVYDEARVPVSDAEVEVTLTGPDGSRLPFPMGPLGNGRFALEAGPLPEGEYTFTASATRGGTTLGSDRGGFAVGALALELRDLYADVPLMRELARRSGGEALLPGDLPALGARLADGLAPRRVETRRDTELWRLAPLLALLFLLLTAEWVLRKRSGMV
jgi:hypothetical protein